MSTMRMLRKVLKSVGSRRYLCVAYTGVILALLAGMTSNALADSAQDCEQDKDLKLRVQGCTQFLNTSPPSDARAIALRYRGSAYEQLGKYDAAITDLTDSIAIKPDANAYWFRGNAYDMKKRYDPALADFNMVIQLAPDFAEAYLNRGSCRFAKGDMAGAIDDFSTMIRKKPDTAHGYFLRARANLVANQPDAAIADLTDFMRIDPKQKAPAYFWRALAYEAKGRADLAEADFANAVAINERWDLERRWVQYLKTIQAEDDYGNWSDKPLDLYLRR